MARNERRRFRRPNEISNIPLDSPRETHRRLDNKNRRRGYVQGGPRTKVVRTRQKQAAARTVVVVVVVFAVVAAAALAWFGGRTLFVQRQLGESVVKDSALRKVVRDPMPKAGPFTIAVVFTRGGKLDSAGVLGVDAANKRAWLVAFPQETAVPLTDGVVRISEAFSDRGPAPVVAAMESVYGTEVVGYLEIALDEVASIASGPVETGADVGVVARQRGVIVPLARTLAETRDSFGMLSLGRSAAGAIRTDLDMSDLSHLAEALAQVPGQDVAVLDAPASERKDASVPDVAAVRATVADLRAGKRRSSAGAKRVVPSKVSVEVRNGIGVTGVGADAARRLKAAGYRIGDVGNAGQFVYKETLVIHKGNEAAAKQVARELPVGRVVPSRGMYGFDATVLVVIGKDWVRQP